MKVKELRDLLKELPDDADVILLNNVGAAPVTEPDFDVVEIASAEMRKTCVVITPGDETLRCARPLWLLRRGMKGKYELLQSMQHVS